jgi:nitrate/nitrite transport system substrate-binding protein
VGEPWNAHAAQIGVGFTAATSQAVWPDHPEKVLGATAQFVDRHPNAARALVMALLEASRWVDMVGNRSQVARLIAGPQYVGADLSVIEPRFLGHYDDGQGRRWIDPHPLQFHADGAVNFPYLSDGMWFLTQHRRWGLLRADPDYLAVAARVNRIELYRQAAQQVRVPVPQEAMRSATLLDGVVWDGRQPQRYAADFALHAMTAAA